MVSDANIYSGCIPGTYQRIGGLDCVIEKNGFIHVVGQEILAGAWYQNNRSVEFLVNQVGLNFLDAWTLQHNSGKADRHRPTTTPTRRRSHLRPSTFDKQTLHIEQSVFCGKNHLD